MKIVITYGTYDLFHYGHIALLKRAKALGDYLIVGVTSDAFDKQRGKLNVQQTLSERMKAVEETGLADLIVAEEFEGQKIADIQKYKADIFTVGSDWKGKFDYLKKYCEVVYLDRTKGVSSTEIRTNRHAIVKLGCIGMGVPTDRFLKEIQYVSGIEVVSCFYEEKIPTGSDALSIARNLQITECKTMEEIFSSADAVYIAAARGNNYRYIKAALEHGRHVLCESPMFLCPREAKEMHSLAGKKNLVLMEAIKTLYFPAFEHLMLLIGSRVIGDIVQVDTSCSQRSPLLDMQDKYQGSMYDFGIYVLLPIFKLLGTQYTDCRLKNFYNENGVFCKLTTGYMEFSNAAATFKAGKGIKTEGEMIITGSEGYIYVPAPWWKPDYFEVRYEDLRNTKKYFFKYEGEGLRYEADEFLKQINGARRNCKWTLEESLASAEVIALFRGSQEAHNLNDVPKSLAAFKASQQ